MSGMNIVPPHSDEALRQMEDRERRMAALDAAIARGRADIVAGRVHDLDEVCDALDAELSTTATDRSECRYPRP
jgi:antitoxin ParD1/3/4